MTLVVLYWPIYATPILALGIALAFPMGWPASYGAGFVGVNRVIGAMFNLDTTLTVITRTTAEVMRLLRSDLYAAVRRQDPSVDSPWKMSQPAVGIA